MAEHELIDSYVAEVRRTLGRHRDVAELADEIADHLRCSARDWQKRGLDADAAERRSLAAFGDPGLVARAYAAERRRGLAVPTRFTRTAGWLLVAAGVGWVLGSMLLLAAAIADRTYAWEGLPQTLYALGAWLLWVASIPLVTGLVGVYRRHGGGPRSAVIALAALASGAVLSIAPWFAFGWLPALALGGGLFAMWLRQRELAPPAATRALAVGPLVAAVVAVAVAAVDLTDPTLLTQEEHLALQAVVHGGLLAFVVGLFGLGRWLVAETPIDDPEQVLIG